MKRNSASPGSASISYVPGLSCHSFIQTMHTGCRGVAPDRRTLGCGSWILGPPRTADSRDHRAEVRITSQGSGAIDHHLVRYVGWYSNRARGERAKAIKDQKAPTTCTALIA
ncbi:MAG: hypothetical protein SGJ20_10010 [Planctomycetota bacterium]|nr:hypothetical protein [Planctomycetota bacterium]